MSRKKRVLWVNEASYLSTGYATYGLEVMKRLHATGKYELCELASYAPPHDPRGADIPWAFVSAMPDPDSPREMEAYHAVPTFQFGEWRFEETCLRFRPDVVMDIRDWWMFEFQERSPLRPFYHWAIMPTVDAAPQDEQWVATFQNADGVFAYSDWGLDVLREQTRGRLNAVCSAPPGADLDTLRPVPDKRAHREAMGVDPDCLIVGTVMRNQKRKLYPDLVQAFQLFLRTAHPELAKKTFLYLHTSYPDVGWDIPRLITEAGIAHKCVFTYHCRECGASFPAFFSDARTVCRRCGSPAATLPNSHAGISRGDLAAVINTFDCYVQYANSEGFGMPQVEAGACGVPVFAVDYSAMSDVVRKLGGYPIPVQRLYRENETHCWRALPDNRAFVDQLIRFLELPPVVRARKGFEARRAVERHYTYDRTAALWEAHIDAAPGGRLSWDAPSRARRPETAVPDGMSNEEFVRWGMVHVAGRPDLLNSYTALRMVRDLNWGMTTAGTGGVYFNDASTLGVQARQQHFDRELAMRELLKLNALLNHWEARRTAK